jgi:hypothetical protein
MYYKGNTPHFGMEKMAELLIGDSVWCDSADGTVCGEVVGFTEHHMFGEIWTRMQVELPDGTLRTIAMGSDFMWGK